MKKFGFESNNYPTSEDQITKDLKSLRYFKLHRPNSGHYNDAYSLKAYFKHSYNEDLILLLDLLGVKANVVDEEPPEPKGFNAPDYDEITLSGLKKWLKKIAFCEINGEKFYISYGQEGLILSANPGDYEVDHETILKAKRFENLADKSKLDERAE